MELYYSIMNIVDFLAKNEVVDSVEKSLIDTLETLRTISGDSIEDIASANDSDSSDWENFILDIKRQFENGERI